MHLSQPSFDEARGIKKDVEVQAQRVFMIEVVKVTKLIFGKSHNTNVYLCLSIRLPSLWLSVDLIR
jgi:hypothetical protein